MAECRLSADTAGARSDLPERSWVAGSIPPARRLRAGLQRSGRNNRARSCRTAPTGEPGAEACSRNSSVIRIGKATRSGVGGGLLHRLPRRGHEGLGRTPCSRRQPARRRRRKASGYRAPGIRFRSRAEGHQKLAKVFQDRPSVLLQTGWSAGYRILLPARPTSNCKRRRWKSTKAGWSRSTSSVAPIKCVILTEIRSITVSGKSVQYGS